MCLGAILTYIRIMEQEAKRDTRTFKFVELGVEGKVAGAEEWFYHKEGQMLLNGSQTATDVPPTRLSLEQIQQAVKIGRDPEAFEKKRALDCKSDICTSMINNKCPWYAWGLRRCRRIRYEMRQAAASNG